MLVHVLQNLILNIFLSKQFKFDRLPAALGFALFEVGRFGFVCKKKISLHTTKCKFDFELK